MISVVFIKNVLGKLPIFGKNQLKLNDSMLTLLNIHCPPANTNEINLKISQQNQSDIIAISFA